MVNLDDTSGQNAPVVLYRAQPSMPERGQRHRAWHGGLRIRRIHSVHRQRSGAIQRRFQQRAFRRHALARTRRASRSAPASPLAINASGAAAGADVPPAQVRPLPRRRTRDFGRGAGSATELAPDTQVSVGYAIDDSKRVAGMLEDAQPPLRIPLGNGALRRLDDAVNAPGWRFECAYAVYAERWHRRHRHVPRHRRSLRNRRLCSRTVS